MRSGGRDDEERDMVSVIRERLEVGEYAIDPHAVATAMLARCGERNTLSELWSEVLVAAQFGDRAAGEREPLAGYDSA